MSSGVYVLGVTSVLSLGAAAGFAVAERKKLDELERGCAPYCSDDQVEGTRRLLSMANASLIVGGVSGACAIIWYVADAATGSSSAASRMSLLPSRFSWGVEPRAKGALVEWKGTFRERPAHRSCQSLTE